jgi:hypothetical protein
MTDPRIFWQHTAQTGEIICVICCESKPREAMEPVSDAPDRVWDVCRECAQAERQHGAVY